MALSNQIAPYPVGEILSSTSDSVSPKAPLGGIEASGWKVVYTDVEPQMLKAEESVHSVMSAAYSIGLFLKNDGTIIDSIVTMPAYKAGIAPGMKLVAVNGRRFTPDVLHAALRASVHSSQPLRLLVVNDDYYKTYKIDYHGGERYPHLVPEPGRPDLLDQILKPLSAQ